jgi:hypothetical protein
MSTAVAHDQRIEAPGTGARRSCLAELIQSDGCDHEWFEAAR